MKKNVIAGIMISVLCLCIGCNKPTSYPDGENPMKVEENVAEETNVEDEIERVDETAEKITFSLNKNVTIDATVTPKNIYDKELGNYTYCLVHDKFHYVGEKTLEEAGDLYNTIVFAGRALTKEMSFLYNPEDEKLKEDVLLQVIEDAGKLGIDVEKYKNMYKVVRLDEKLYDKIHEYYRADWNNTWIPDEVLESKEKYTIVFLQHEVEDGIAMLEDGFLYFMVDKEEDVKGIEEVVYEDFEAPQTVMISTGDEVEAVINEKDDIELVCKNSRYEIKEKIGTVTVKSLKEMLYIIKNEFANVYTPETVIYDINLAYGPYLSEERDENGIRKLYQTPYWCVSYFAKQEKDGELFTQRKRIFYLGATGEKVYEE